MSGGRPEIRWASDDDLAARRELIYRNWLEAYAGIFSREEVESVFSGRVPLETSWAGERGTSIGTLVAVVDGQVAGLTSIATLRSGAAEITHLYVGTTHHRSGIGTALWDAATALLRERGVRRLHVWTLARGPAIAFYHSRGCVSAGSATLAIGTHVEPVVEFVHGVG